MIKVVGYRGSVHLINPAGILSVVEAGPSSAWHGIRSFIRLIDGTTIEAVETLAEIEAAISKQMQEQDQ